MAVALGGIALMFSKAEGHTDATGTILLVNHENDWRIFGADGQPFLADSYDDSARLYKAQRPLLEKKLAEQGYRTSLVLHMDIRPGFTGQLTEKPKLVDEILADKQAK